jgi:hypothetical protein
LGIVAYNTTSNISAMAYPNPVGNGTTIAYTLDAAATVDIQIMSLTGQVLNVVRDGSKETAGEHTVGVDTANLPSGIFFAKISITSNNKKSVKLIKLVK